MKIKILYEESHLNKDDTWDVWSTENKHYGTGIAVKTAINDFYKWCIKSKVAGQIKMIFLDN